VAVPMRNLPADLRAKENSPEFLDRGERFARDLLKPDRRPSDDEPLFFSLQQAGAVVVLTLPEPAGACLVSFTTPIRAADYVRVQFGSEPKPHYLASTAKQFVKMAGNLRQHSNIKKLAVDRCPRCDTLALRSMDEIRDTDDAVQVWAVRKAVEVTLSHLYGEYAVTEARKHNLAVALEVMLQLVGHVTAEDPRAHMLLGKLAIRLGDMQLLGEAMAYLAALKQADRLIELDAARKTGVVHF
jgi:hypothetical protein